MTYFPYGQIPMMPGARQSSPPATVAPSLFTPMQSPFNFGAAEKGASPFTIDQNGVSLTDKNSGLGTLLGPIGKALGGLFSLSTPASNALDNAAYGGPGAPVSLAPPGAPASAPMPAPRPIAASGGARSDPYTAPAAPGYTPPHVPWSDPYTAPAPGYTPPHVPWSDPYTAPAPGYKPMVDPGVTPAIAGSYGAMGVDPYTVPSAGAPQTFTPLPQSTQDAASFGAMGADPGASAFMKALLGS